MYFTKSFECLPMQFINIQYFLKFDTIFTNFFHNSYTKSSCFFAFMWVDCIITL